MSSELEAAVEKICRVCLESNLTEEIRISRCEKCGKRYCIHFASNIDPKNCTECLAEVTLVREVITNTYQHEHYDEEKDEVITTEYKRRAKLIRLEGMDWLFAQRKIPQLSDDALALAIEYHRQILQGMLQEREERRNKQAHRYANVQMDTSKVINTEVKTTKKISSTKKQANANAVLQAMLAAGMKPEDILAMLSSAGVKK